VAVSVAGFGVGLVLVVVVLAGLVLVLAGLVLRIVVRASAWRLLKGRGSSSPSIVRWGLAWVWMRVRKSSAFSLAR
jgi:hypothetical protein